MPRGPARHARLSPMQKPLWVRWHAFVMDKRVSKVREVTDDYVDGERVAGRRLSIDWIFGGKSHGISALTSHARRIDAVDVESMMRDSMREEVLRWFEEQQG
jgi:hypothetical protein